MALLQNAARTTAPQKNPRTTHADLLHRLGQDIDADLLDYHGLHALLIRQFDAIVHHDSARLIDIAAAITPLVDALEQRRVRRVAIVGALLGPAHPVLMAELFKRLPPPYLQSLQPRWHELETTVSTCKELNGRNCKLMMEQHEIMQRVLNGERDTYAPL